MPKIDYGEFLRSTDQQVYRVLERALLRVPMPEEVRQASLEGERRALAIRNEHSGAKARILQAICEETGAEPYVALLVLQNVPQLAFVYGDEAAQDELTDDAQKQAKVVARFVQKPGP